MIIEPKDLKRLIVRVVAVTVALRAIHLFSVDLNAQEVAAAWALPGSQGTLAPLTYLVSAWREICGGVAGLLRAPTLLADAALPLIAIGYARASGWGTLSGLMAGLLLAVAPLGLDEGWRADGSTVLAALSFAAAWTLRHGLRRARMSAVVASWLLWAMAVALHPAALVAAPAGLWLIGRSVAMGRFRLVAALGWLAVLGAGLGFGAMGSIDQASEWLQDPSLNAGAVLWQADWASSLASLRALGPAGASGAVSTLFDSSSAP
ncbi:MAG: hypothetical protein CMH53_01265, partial [Myxococcales bacterium]|nr:hypothetical protein [Myxococcales bacterium]